MNGDEVYALYDDDWHAAKIVKMKGKQVDIMYEGFDDVVTVNVSDLHSG